MYIYVGVVVIELWWVMVGEGGKNEKEKKRKEGRKGDLGSRKEGDLGSRKRTER